MNCKFLVMKVVELSTSSSLLGTERALLMVRACLPKYIYLLSSVPKMVTKCIGSV